MHARQFFLHMADCVIGREAFVDYMLFENVGHLVCHKHPCSFVVVVFVDFVLGGERVVFGVFASSSVLGVRDCNACCPTVIFASPCFRTQAVHCRKLSDGNASACLDEFVPVSGKNLPLSES